MRPEIESAWACVLAPNSCYYLSTPITTGEPFMRWKYTTKLQPGTQQYDREHWQEVRAVNYANAREMIRTLRGKLRDPVCDPTQLLHRPDWSQEEYIEVWKRFMEVYCHTIIMAHGWEYSTGCATEFLHAIKCNLDLRNGFMHHMKPVDGARLLEKSIREYKQLALSSYTLSAILQELDILIEQGHEAKV